MDGRTRAHITKRPLAQPRGLATPSARVTTSPPVCQQFDEYFWFDETCAVQPLAVPHALPSTDLPETYPFGL
jgi:hypothetical protein